MQRLARYCATIAVLVAVDSMWLAGAAHGSDFEFSLQVQAGKETAKTVRTEEIPSSKPLPRPVFQIARGKTLFVSWKATSTAKEATFTDVLVHCVIVAEKEPGQIQVPDLKETLQESAMTMDFKPGNTASGRFSIAIDEPGAYLVRVESIGMLSQHGHEHFAALDLVCK